MCKVGRRRGIRGLYDGHLAGVMVGDKDTRVRPRGPIYISHVEDEKAQCPFILGLVKGEGGADFLLGAQLVCSTTYKLPQGVETLGVSNNCVGSSQRRGFEHR